jgi:RNA polymerase-binding transcription factor DksA
METEINTEYFKEKLLAEKNKLETDLSSIGRINPDSPSDWEAVPENDGDERNADPNSLADSIEEYESRTATVKELEKQLKEVREALEKIEKGTYGICEVSGEKIEKERLEVNPSARTCKAHLNSQL